MAEVFISSRFVSSESVAINRAAAGFLNDLAKVYWIVVVGLANKERN